MEGSVVYHVGNVLLMAALAYALLFIALKYGQIQLYPDWWVLVNNVRGDIVVILCVCVLCAGMLTMSNSSRWCVVTWPT